MNRRSFLIGSGSILTTAFVDKADWFIRNKNTVVPLIEPEQVIEKIYFVNTGSEYELRFVTPDFDMPDAMTNREALERYCGHDLSPNYSNPLSVFRNIYESYRIRPSNLDEPAYDDFYIKSWARTDSNNAKAYNFLRDLDSFGSKNATGIRRGDLRFIDGYHPSNSYLGGNVP